MNLEAFSTSTAMLICMILLVSVFCVPCLSIYSCPVVTSVAMCFLTQDAYLYRIIESASHSAFLAFYFSLVSIRKGTGDIRVLQIACLVCVEGALGVFTTLRPYL